MSRTRAKYHTGSTTSTPIILKFLEHLSPEERGALAKIIDVAGASLPMDAIFADLGGDDSVILGTEMDEETLRFAALATFTHLLNLTTSKDKVLDMMNSAEPFRSDWKRTVEIIESEYPEGHDNE